MATLIEYAYLANDVYNDNDADQTHHTDGFYRPLLATGTHENMLPHWIGLPSTHETKDMANFTKLVAQDSFFARLYANTITRETIIAYRGTETSSVQRFAGDAVADMEIRETGEVSSQDIDALNFYTWAKQYLSNQQNHQFSRFPKLTGHSLGGYLAQLIGSKYPGTIVVTFNAPGLLGSVNPIMERESALKTCVIMNEHLINLLQVAECYSNYNHVKSQLYKATISNFNLDYDPIHHIGTQVGSSYTVKGLDTHCHLYNCILQGHRMGELLKSLEHNSALSAQHY